MSQYTVWKPTHVEFLFILREVLNYSYSLCECHMEREFGFNVSKNSLISLYRRQLENGYTLPPCVVAEVKEAAGLP